MSEVFEGYEREYCQLSANLSRKCASATTLNGEKKKQMLSEIRSGLEDGETLIRKMDLEARSVGPNVKVTLVGKLREYKTDLRNLKNEVVRLTSVNAIRNELLDPGNSDASTVSGDERGRMLMNTERINQSSERIKESRRVILETEDLGASILQDLHQQRQSLLHVHKSLHGVDDNISRSKKVLTAMSRRMSRNKCIMGTMIVSLIFAVLLILYIKLTR